MPTGPEPRSSPTPREPAPRTPAVVQAFAALDALADRREGMRLSELVRELDVPKSSAHRLLSTLCEIGAVVRNDTDGRFVLGSKMSVYAEQVGHANTGLLGVFYALAEQIRDRYDETVQLGVLSGAGVTFIAYVETTQPVRLFTRVGRHLPAHASASGKAMLAFREEKALQAVLDAGLPRLTEATICTEAALRAALRTVRERGYATEVEEMSRNLSCFSAPVLDNTGMAVAAVTACVPTSSVDAHQAELLVDEVRWAAAEMARYL